MIISNTPNLEGYRITDYLGNVAGAHYYAPGGIIGEGLWGNQQSKLINIAYDNAISYMIDNSPTSTNAIVGIQMTITQMPLGAILVGVSGTAVRIEKIVTEEEKRRLQEEKERAEKERQEKTRELLKNAEKTGINPDGREAVYPIEKGNGKVECPNCGTVQNEGRHVCFKCGVPFMY